MIDFSQIFSKYLPDESLGIIAKADPQNDDSLEASSLDPEQPTTFQTRKNTRTPKETRKLQADHRPSFFDKLSSVASGVLSLPVHFYRYFISPILPVSCRFEPSCSAYALDALKIHGPIKGCYYTIKRLMRCHPWGGSGYDPVIPLHEDTTSTALIAGDLSIDHQQNPPTKSALVPRKTFSKSAIRPLHKERFTYEKAGISVIAEPEFVFQASQPENNKFVWRCDISLFNLSNEDLKLLRHMWTITKSDGIEIEINDESAEEEIPILVSGAALFHSSIIPIDAPSAIIKGKYEMEDPSGKILMIHTPDFSLDSLWANRFIH